MGHSRLGFGFLRIGGNIVIDLENQTGELCSRS